MWARNLEFAVACWLGMSPFLFSYPEGETRLFVHDFACALAIACLSVACYAPRLHRAHLGTLAIALWLTGFAWVASRTGATPITQNHFLSGLVLAMLAIVPSNALAPPRRYLA